MFDIGFPELILVSVVALLILGPERLPEALRTMGLWLGRLRRSFTSVKTEIEREIGMDDIRKQLHNEAVMADIKRIEDEVRAANEEARNIGSAVPHTDAAEPAAAEPASTETPPATTQTDATGPEHDQPSTPVPTDTPNADSPSRS